MTKFITMGKKRYHITPCFIKYIPEELAPGVLYVSMEYATVVHLCACGCGEKVVTPLSPTDWNLHYDGRNITLSPSIGNFEFNCMSHYYIRNNRIAWCEDKDRKKKKSRKRKWWHLWK